jgi:hypothetical protein
MMASDIGYTQVIAAVKLTWMGGEMEGTGLISPFMFLVHPFSEIEARWSSISLPA